jgi:hypothetical protein
MILREAALIVTVQGRGTLVRVILAVRVARLGVRTETLRSVRPPMLCQNGGSISSAHSG